jgi:hypothetical protein
MPDSVWVIEGIAFIGYFKVAEHRVIKETESEYQLVTGCTTEWVGKEICYPDEETAETKLRGLMDRLDKFKEVSRWNSPVKKKS